MNINLKVGDVVVNSGDFTSPIGVWFRKGETFKVLIVGTVNTLLAHTVTGSKVWIEGNRVGDCFVDQQWVADQEAIKRIPYVLGLAGVR